MGAWRIMTSGTVPSGIGEGFPIKVVCELDLQLRSGMPDREGGKDIPRELTLIDLLPRSRDSCSILSDKHFF